MLCRSSKAKSKFTKEEDETLKKLVASVGKDWEEICECMPGRNVRQIRDRWNNYLSPDVNNSPFTSADDELLVSKFKEIGPKWVQMKQFFKGRSDTALKNRWLILERKKSHIENDESPAETKTEEEANEKESSQLFPKIGRNDEECILFWQDICGFPAETASTLPISAADYFGLY